MILIQSSGGKPTIEDLKEWVPFSLFSPYHGFSPRNKHEAQKYLQQHRTRDDKNV